MHDARSAAWKAAWPFAREDGSKNIMAAVLTALLFGSFGVYLSKFGMHHDGGWSSVIETILFATLCCAAAYIAILIAQVFYLPASMQQAAQAEIHALKNRLTPLLSVTLPPQLTEIEFHRSALTGGGAVQTALLAREFAIRLHVKNDSETTVQGCEARLIAAWKRSAEDFQSLGMIEAISLTWDRTNKTKFSTRIGPGEIACVYIGATRQQGNIVLWRDLNELPAEYTHLFRDAGTYRLLVQIKGNDGAPLKVLLEIETQPMEVAINRMPISKASLQIVTVANGRPVDEI